MLLSFPTFYPDELFYSIVARYGERMGYRTRKGLVTELFANPNTSAVVSFPCRLSDLINQLPPGHPCAVPGAIVNHCTFLPWYAPFLPPERVTFLRAAMMGNGGRSTCKSSGIMAGRVPVPIWMRFCPECFREDIEEYGELYWRRLHQISGISICPKHKVFLENSWLCRNSVIFRQGFEMPPSALMNSPARPMSRTDGEDQILLKLAQTAHDLLNGNWPVRNLEAIRSRYLAVLRKNGFVTPGGNLRFSDICAKLKLKFSDQLLKDAGCELDSGDRANWIARLLHKSSRSQSPIRHLILLNFLDLGLEEFFAPTKIADIQPVAKCDCPNAICSAFGTPSAMRIGNEYSRRSKVYLDICECDVCKCVFAQRPFKIDGRMNIQIRDYGSAWKSKLEALWKDPTMSLRGIANIFKLPRLSIKRAAFKCGLKFPRRAQWKTTSRGVPIKNRKRVLQKIKRLRHRWVGLLQASPTSGVNALRNKHGAVYSSLYRLDYEWLMANRPPRHHSPGAKCKNWAARDAESSAKLLRLLALIPETDHLPIRLTRTRLLSAIGAKKWVENHPHKMPILDSLLGHLTEKRIGAACRRIGHIEKVFKSKGFRLSEPQLKRLAGIKNEFNQEPTIAHRVEKSLNSMRKNFNGTPKSKRLFLELHQHFDNLN
jgi:hypothetical protein